jgi:hypothetical protein
MKEDSVDVRIKSFSFQQEHHELCEDPTSVADKCFIYNYPSSSV